MKHILVFLALAVSLYAQRNSVANNATRAALSNALLSRAAAGEKSTVIQYGDSLTNGSSGGRPYDTWAPALQSALGYGGRFVGILDANSTFTPLVYGTDGSYFNDGTVSHFGAMGYTINSTPDFSGDGKYGFSGVSLSVAAASNKTLYLKLPRERFTRVTLFYLLDPSGGSFNFGKPGSLSAASVSCVGTKGLGTTTLRIWTGTHDDNVIALTSINGYVRLYGFLVENDTVGAVTGIGGWGGQRASDFATLDATAFTKWITVLNPAVFVLNLGTNDYSVRSASQYKADMQTIITRVRSASATLPILLEVAHTSGSLSNYRTVIRELTTENSFVYQYDSAEAVGVNGGTLLFDTVHLNSIGCAVSGRGLFNILGGDALLRPDQAWSFPPPLTLPDVITDTAKDSYFTATSTNWAGYNGGSVTYSQNVGVTVACPSNNTGALLNGTAAGGVGFGSLEPGGLYYIRVKVVLSSGGAPNLYYQTTAFASPIQTTWPNGYFGTGASGTYATFLLRIPTSATVMSLWLVGNSGANFTIKSFEVKRVPDDSPGRTYAQTATLDFPSVAATGGVQDLTVPFGGAELGDGVTVNRADGTMPTSGLILSAQVSAANVVTVRATNATGSPIDPASAPYRLVVKKP